MPSVKETARIRLANLVIKPADVRKLAAVVVAAGNLKTTAQTAFVPVLQPFLQPFSFSIITADKRSYESDVPDVFGEDEGLLDTKPVWSIEMRFSDSINRSTIVIDMAHGDLPGQFNNISVSSVDRDWVAATVHKLQETLNGFEKQATWPRKWKPALVIVGALGIGTIWGVFLDFLNLHVLHIRPITPRPHWADIIAPIAPLVLRVADFVAGLAPSWYLTNALIGLWPSVELRMGREWNQQEKKRRDRLALFFSLAILPLLLQFLYDVFKPLWSHQ